MRDFSKQPEQPDNPIELEAGQAREYEASKSLQLQQLLQIMDREQAFEVYETLKQLSEGEFKESKMRDANSELMIMWHGSPRRFDAFRTDAAGQWRWRNAGVHFSSSSELIEQYADKAYASLRFMLYEIAKQKFNLEAGATLSAEQLAEAKTIYNQMVEDLIANGEKSVHYKTVNNVNSLTYGNMQLATEEALEIFNGELPTRDNTYFDEGNGILLGNGISKYEYATVLNIQDPYTAEATNLDAAFEAGEQAHREQGKDGTILLHKEAVVGMGNMKVAETKGTYSAAVYDPSKITILGRKEGKNFVKINTDKKNSSPKEQVSPAVSLQPKEKFPSKITPIFESEIVDATTGEKVGQIDFQLNHREKTIIIQDVLIDKPKQGYGVEVYKTIQQMYPDYQLQSSEQMTKKETPDQPKANAIYLWEKLVKLGWAEGDEKVGFKMKKFTH